jgi:hypothetical protein
LSGSRLAQQGPSRQPAFRVYVPRVAR